MGAKKIVIDTNNLISALGWNGKSRILFGKVLQKEYVLFISRKQLDEITKVLQYQRLGFTEQQRKDFLTLLNTIATIVDTKTILHVCDDPDDNMLFECAVEAQAEYIISGDAHVTTIKQFRHISIMTVHEFLYLNASSTAALS
jgi:putative PIN family toxin of toxin-antitoxin system